MQVELKQSEVSSLLFAAKRERERLFKNYTKRKTASAPRAMEISTLDRSIEVLGAAMANHILQMKEELSNGPV